MRGGDPETAVVRLPRGRRRHALAIDGRASCGQVAKRGWRQVSLSPDDVDCPGCKAAMVVS